LERGALKDEVLALHRAQQMGTEMEVEHDMSATTEESASRGEAMWKEGIDMENKEQ